MLSYSNDTLKLFAPNPMPEELEKLQRGRLDATPDAAEAQLGGSSLDRALKHLGLGLKV